MRIAGETVLLTGATGGIGQALARRLVSAGADLIVTGRGRDTLRAMEDTTGARAVAADLSDPDQVLRLAEQSAAARILVANAAVPASGDLLEYTAEQIDRALTVNLRSVILLARAMAPAMAHAGRGHLAFVGSMSGKAALPQSSLYTATKFGLRGFAHALRQDLRPLGVGVSLIQPGLVRDAGMFFRTGAPIPPGTGTVSPDQVAEAVLRAIEHDRAEINVAPIQLRLSCALATQFPAVAAWAMSRRRDAGTNLRVVSAQRSSR